MLTQQYDETTTSTRSQSDRSQNVSLGDAVKEAVESYIHEMGDQPLNDLYELVVSEIEAPLLACVLRHTENNQSRSAAMLGVNRGTLRKKLKKYDML